MNENEDTDLLVITEAEAGERLDKILAQRFDSVQSRTYFQMLIENGHVLLNNAPVKKRAKPVVGDEVQVNFILTPEIGLTAEAIPLNIVYEDSDLLVVNKAAGMVVHPAAGNWSGTFVNALLHHCNQMFDTFSCNSEMPSSSHPRPGIVHRLDKDTSGLLIAAKTLQAQQKLITMFSQRQIHKEYSAICIGNPGNIEINAPIGRHPIHRKQMTVLPEGKQALSVCRTLAFDGKHSLVRIVLATGRTHQIRVHMKHIGTPILGDATYGNTQANNKFGVARQLLHAQLLRFSHPMTGKLIELEAHPPTDMATWVRVLIL
jgi:23S rRNA pseudouridine1911/1915/1917 synthase